METPLGQRLPVLEKHPHYPEALEVAERIKNAGHSALLAGGCVRDACLGNVAKDLDFATSAHPDEIEKLFPKTLPVGKAFGTMVVVMETAHFEVTTFRRDGNYLDGRRPETVEFTDAREDAKRRDFTVNALFYDPFKHELVDYVNGIADLGEKIIRTVGVPEERFTEDHLRILRAVRFSSQLGFDIEIKTWKAICEMSPKIASVSKERVFQELMKLLSGAHPSVGLERLVRSGLAKEVWPSLAQLHESKDLWRAFMNRLKETHEPAAIFAAFQLTNPAAPLARELERLKPPKHLMQLIDTLVRAQSRLWEHETTKADRVRLFAMPEWKAMLELSEAEAAVRPNGINRLEAWIAEFMSVCDAKGNLPKSFLTGEDLLKLGFEPGPLLGKVLEDLYVLQLEGRITSKKDAEAMGTRRLSSSRTSNEV